MPYRGYDHRIGLADRRGISAEILAEERDLIGFGEAIAGNTERNEILLGGRSEANH